MAEFDEHETIEDAIDASARGLVKRTREGDRETEYVSLKDQIAADQYIAAKGASARKHFGLRMTKLIPPGGG